MGAALLSAEKAVVLAMKPRLLVVELHHLGDAVMSFPFIRGAREKFEIHVLCRPSVAPVYRLLSGGPIVHEWEPPWVDDRECGPLSAIRLAKKQGLDLRPRQFDAAACVWADVRAEIIMASTGAKQRIGFPMTRGNYYAAGIPWRARRLAAGRLLEHLGPLVGISRPLLTTSLHRVEPSQHHLRCWEQLAEACGVICDYSSPWINAASTENAMELRSKASVSGRRLLAVHACARLPSKQWSLEKWRALCALPSVRAKFDLLEIVPADNQPQIPDMPHVVTADTESLAAVLVGADALVGHDSFPAHLAAALGKPVVTIFGSGEPNWFAPWNNRARAVQRRACPLHPCIDRCGMDSYLCLEAVSVDDAAAQVMKLFPSA